MPLRRETQLQATLVAVFIVLTIALGLANIFFSRAEETSARDQVFQELQAVIDLKRQQIATWRADHLGRAQAWQESLRLGEILQRQSGGTLSPQAREQLLGILRPLVDFDDTRGFCILANDGTPLVSTAPQPYLAAPTLNLLNTADYGAQPQLSDLQTAPSGEIYLDIVAPIRAPYSDARLGFLVQRIAPEKYLFPLIQSWPGPSKTAETLLVRRDGNQLLYLNQLRHQSGTAMHLTRPVDDPDLPAAHAVLGQEDVFTGRDYRGKAVFAATRQIPHTPWAMVTKLDTEEVLAPLRRNNLHAFGWSLLLMVAGAAFTLYLLRQQRLLFNEQQAREKRAAEELARTQARLMEAQRIGRIGSWERDLATGEMWWSEEAYRLFGLDPETDAASLEGFLERVHPEDRERMQGSTEQHPEDGHPLTLEFRIILPNGEVRHCINHGRLFRDAAGQPVRIGGTTQDITERKLAEEEFRRQSAQLQAVLHNLPQGISVFDEKLRLQLWNEGLREVLVLPREALYRGAPFEDLVRYPAERGEYGPGDVEEKIQARKTLAMKFEPHRFERTHLNGRTTLIQGEPLFEDNRLAGFITTYTDITESKRVQETLEKQNTVLQSILDNIPDGISLFDANLGMVACNEQLKTLLDLPESLFAKGLPNLKEVLEFNAARGEYGAEHPEQLVQEILKRASEPALHAFERTRPNGTVLHVRGVPLPTGGFVTVYTDVTQHRRAEERLLLAEKVFANSPEAIMICDQGNRIISVNQAFCDITGYAQDEVLGRDPRILASGRHDKEFYGRMWQTLRESGAWAGEIWDRRKNGEIYPKWMTINALHDTQSGALTHYITLFSDITERKETEARIHHLAHHDPLTGLPNRFTLEARLDQSLAHARRHGNKVAVMFLDLDRFKTINDSLGHAVGDALLMEIAHRLRTSVRESDTVARLGGDEFVVILPEVDSANDAAHVAAKIIEQIALPVQVAPHALHTSASVGISLYPDDGDAVAVVMQNADTAMYHAKAVGRNNFQFFAAAMNLAATERLELERKLRQAMAKQEFTLHYQPQFSVAADRITGVEALLRWNHPDDGMIPPDRFIPLAEETGLIVGLGDWVLEAACRQLKTWLDAGLPPLRMAVNLSVRQLRQQDFPQTVARIVAAAGIPPSLLELEVTESGVMEHPEEAVIILQALNDMGITLAIDDFGTGYSSLAYLKLLPIDRLKIDRSFVRDIERDPNDAAIARGTIALAHSLGLEVVAEGVENAEQLRLLAQDGCDEMQGYYFSPPLAADAASEFLARPAPRQPG